ncbi:hypothetical protein [Salinarimonas rosea]|uniref:hypothetical protein n=1 Tax=Salinarimonas rosea TaxID=552063 RepID=UPI000406F77E|nr:hypothetical protein [Salinarimonas rosea]
MAWNSKCPNGGPIPFDPHAAVAAADFTNSVYVNTATVGSTKNLTRYAYTYVDVPDGNGDTWRVCVVGHAHCVDDGTRWIAGNTFICGWDGFDVQTSAAHLAQIVALPASRGTFPDAARYPVKLTGAGATPNVAAGGSTSSAPPEAGPVPLRPPKTSTSARNIPIAKYFVFNETGNIMIASTVQGDAAITQAAQDLFQEVTVFFAALTKAVSSTLRPSAKNKANPDFLDYYTLYDYEPIEAIVARSGMFVAMNREDYLFESNAGSTTFNTDLIASILGFAATDGADVGALTEVLRSMGKQATVSWKRSGKYDKMGHLTFVCEYLLGMPIVNVEYYSIDEDVVKTVVHAGPCVSVTDTSIKLQIHKSSFLFVPPQWLRKYSGDLAAVADMDDFHQLVKDLQSYITGTPVIVSVRDGTGDDASITLTDQSKYVIEGMNFGAFTPQGAKTSGEVTIGGVSQGVTQADWTTDSITFTATKSTVQRGGKAVDAVGPVVVRLGGDGPITQSEVIYTIPG